MVAVYFYYNYVVSFYILILSLDTKTLQQMCSQSLTQLRTVLTLQADSHFWVCMISLLQYLGAEYLCMILDSSIILQCMQFYLHSFFLFRQLDPDLRHHYEVIPEGIPCVLMFFQANCFEFFIKFIVTDLLKLNIKMVSPSTRVAKLIIFLQLTVSLQSDVNSLLRF